MIMKINNVEFEFDSSDGDCADKLEAATAKMNESAKAALETEMTIGETLRAGVQRIRQFFIDAVGADVVGETKGLRAANSFVKCFDELVDKDVADSKAELAKYNIKRVR